MQFEPDVSDVEAGRPPEGTILYELGNAIRHGRRRLHLTVNQLALATDVPFETILMLEWHMMRDIDVITIGKLADALMINLVDEAQQSPR